MYSANGTDWILNANTGSSYSTLNYAIGGTNKVLTFYQVSNTSFYIQNSSAGVYLTAGGTSWTSNSDLRLKNVTGTYTNALADIAQIQPVKFTWKADETNTPQVGVLAQSVQSVVPEAVVSSVLPHSDDTTEYLGVRYTELIPLMIASIQELNTLVTTQAAEIAALKAKLGA